MRDLHNNLHGVRALSPAAATTDNTPLVSQIVDRLGYNALEFFILTGSLADTDATFVVLIEDGDSATLTDAAAVVDAQLLGTELLAAPLNTSDNKVLMIGYNGSKRYVRMTITPSANTGDVYIAAVAVLGHPASAPVTQTVA